MAQKNGENEQLQLREKLERLIADLFAHEPDGLRRLVDTIDHGLRAEVRWRESSRTVAGDVCEALARRRGAWEMIYRLIEAVFEEYGRNPDVEDLYRRVCTSAYAGSLPVSRAVREQTVRTFIERHFPGYQQLRSRDQRGAYAAPDGEDRLEESKFPAVAQYFAILAEGLSVAETNTVRSSRLDVYSFILEGALDYSSCRGLLQQIRLAHESAAFLGRHGADFFASLRRIQKSMTEYFDAGLTPPVGVESCREFLARFPVADSPATEEPHPDFDSFRAMLRALVVLDGRGVVEAELGRWIDEKHEWFSKRLPPRICALLRFRRGLVGVYTGDWKVVRRTLEDVPDGWDPNWTGFLWYELGEFERSLSVYERNREHPSANVRAAAIRSLLAFVPVTHPEFSRRMDLQAARDAANERRAALELAFADVKRNIPAAQSLHDEVQRSDLGLELARLERDTQRSVELRESKLGATFGGAPLMPLFRAYQTLWICGVPALPLRVKEARDFMQIVLGTESLPAVLEVAYLTCTVPAWDHKALEGAATRLILAEGIASWHALLAAQVQLLRGCIGEIEQQGVFTQDTGRFEHIGFHPLLVRVATLVDCLLGVVDYLPSATLEDAGRLCARFLQILPLESQQLECQIYPCAGMVLTACGLLGNSPEELGMATRPLAVMFVNRAMNHLRSLHDGLRQVSIHMSPDYRGAFMSSMLEVLAVRRPAAFELVFGATPFQFSDVERMFAPPARIEAQPAAVLLREVLDHWSRWKHRGYSEPIVAVQDGPGEQPGEALEETWMRLRSAALDALTVGRLAHVVPLGRPWIEEGIYGLSALSIAMGDMTVWIALFESIRPWPLVRAEFGCDLSPLRRALEAEGGDALRRRFHRRLLSADRGEDWTSVVQVLHLLLRAGRSVLVEDSEALRTFWERTHVRDDASAQMFLSLRLLVERSDATAPILDPGFWVHLEHMLAHTPRKLWQERMLSRGLVAILRSVCDAVEASALAGRCASLDRGEWSRLREWLDEFGYGDSSDDRPD